MKITILTVFTIIITVIVISGNVTAQAPTTITYQGRLVDTTGADLPDSATFSLYADSLGGIPLWYQVVPLDVDDNGVFTVELDFGEGADTLFDGSKRYVGLTVGATVMGERQLMTSIPYAMSANRIADNSIDSSKVIDNSLTSEDILDEPGVAGIADTLSDEIYLDTSYSTLASRTITVPGPGYVLVMGNARVAFGVDAVESFFCFGYFGVSDKSNDLPKNLESYLGLTSNAGVAYIEVISVQGLFDVNTAGSYTYYFLGKSGDYHDVITVYNVQLTLIYFPRAYGTVSPLVYGPGDDNTFSEDASLRDIKINNDNNSNDSSIEAISNKIKSIEEQIARLKQLVEQKK